MTEGVSRWLSTESQATFESFYVGQNSLVLSHLQEHPQVWLWGSASVGKSHLLKALVHANPEALLIEDPSKEVPAQLTNPLLLIDNIESWLGNQESEYRLFAAFASTDFNQSRWVIASRNLPNNLDFHMSDLASRFRQFECVQVQEVPQNQHEELLLFWASDRQLRLPKETIRYLLPRVGRSQEDMWSTLKKLDQAATFDSNELTIPYVRKVLNLD